MTEQYRIESDRLFNSSNEVGFVYSPSYGVGWFAQNGHKFPDCATDPHLVRLVIEKDQIEEKLGDEGIWLDHHVQAHPKMKAQVKKIEDYANKKWPGAYWSAETLTVEWASKGGVVSISEFDGSERYDVSYPVKGTAFIL